MILCYTPSTVLTPASQTARQWTEAQAAKGKDVWLQPVNRAKKRSIEQNRTLWMWNREVSQFLGDMTDQEVHDFNKLHFGVPILQRDSVPFLDMWTRCMAPLPYATQMEAVRYIDVTSVFSAKQASQYMDTVVRHWSQQGCVLTQPEERW